MKALYLKFSHVSQVSCEFNDELFNLILISEFVAWIDDKIDGLFIHDEFRRAIVE